WGAAHAFYQTITATFPNTYYATLARVRLEQAEVASAAPDAEAVEFLQSLPLPKAQPVPTVETPATRTRIERSRLLRTAGLDDLADTELRFGARNGAQPRLVAM